MDGLKFGSQAAKMQRFGAVLVLFTGLATFVRSTRHLTPVHVVFLTDCTKYSNWQSIGDNFSFRMSGQPGSVSRVMCCTPEEKANYDESLKGEVDTWTAPSMAVHPKTGDHYAAYNKPEAVLDWLDNQTPKEEYVLVLDSDMILRRPFLVEDMKPSLGWAIGARYTYMIGVANELADRHIPEIPKRNDTFAGPLHRRADQVGGFFFYHRDDLKRMSHGWLKYTEDVRADPEAYRLSGDVYAIHPGDKPWISEMYGYAFGAATAGVWHHWDPISMIYPQYEPIGVPKLMHYGLLFEVNGYKFDKHWHYDFDVTKCPPWDFPASGKVTAGIFTPPPHPDSLPNKSQLSKYYRDLLSIETVATLNAGFCDYHLRHCSPSQQLLDVCTKAIQLYIDTNKAIDEVEKAFKCSDRHVKCAQWAKAGECKTNSDYMKENCAKACGECHSLSEDAPRPEPAETLELLAKLRTTLGGGDATSKKGDPDVRATGKSADPDSSKETQAQVIPHTDASPVKVASPPPSSPPPAPPPNSPPPSPVQHSPPATVLTTEHTAGHIRGAHDSVHQHTPKTRKDLLIRCYRLPLSSAEVKACASAANKGEEWVNPNSSPEAVSDSNAIGALDGEGEALELGSRTGRTVADHDSEDLRHLQAQLDDPPKTGRIEHVKSTLAGLSTWQAVGLWALLLLAVMALVPRLLRLRRRPRSGMRSE